MPNELRFIVKYRVPVKIIYSALTTENEITKFTQTKAVFENTIGGNFNIYDGFITGTNEELNENKKIVQKWKFNNWKDYSDLTLTFKDAPGSESVINVCLKNVPERDKFGTIVDLKILENGFRAQIFKKISDFLGYPQNNDKSDSEDDE